MRRISMRAKAGVIPGIVLLAGILVWRLPSSAPQPLVELTFVRYEYDAIVVKLINRTRSRLTVTGLNVSLDPNTQLADARSDLQLQTTRTKLIEPLPPKIVIQCLPRDSKLRQRTKRLLKKIGINSAFTNHVVSVELPPFDLIPMRP